MIWPEKSYNNGALLNTSFFYYLNEEKYLSQYMEFCFLYLLHVYRLKIYAYMNKRQLRRLTSSCAVEFIAAVFAVNNSITH